MGTMTIRNLDDAVKEKIRILAARKGHSMEEEARRLLTVAVAAPAHEQYGLGSAIRRRFASLGPFKLEPLPRDSTREPSSFK